MRPTIAWFCAKRWTAEDDRELRSHLAVLRDEIEAAGGPAAWLKTEASAWGARPRLCPTPRPSRALPRHQHA